GGRTVRGSTRRGGGGVLGVEGRGGGGGGGRRKRGESGNGHQKHERHAEPAEKLRRKAELDSAQDRRQAIEPQRHRRARHRGRRRDQTDGRSPQRRQVHLAQRPSPAFPDRKNLHGLPRWNALAGRKKGSICKLESQPDRRAGRGQRGYQTREASIRQGRVETKRRSAMRFRRIILAIAWSV